MSSRILLALALAAALLIGLALLLSVDEKGSQAIEVATGTPNAPLDESHEPLAPLATSAAVDTGRTPVVPQASARPQERERKLVHFVEMPSITGVVTSTKDGGPIPMATISALAPAQGPGRRLPLEFPADPTGRYTISNAASGSWSLTCSARGFADAHRVVVVGDDAEPLVADFVLTPVTQRPELLVRLHSPDGRPFFETVDDADLEIAKVLRPVIVATCPPRGSDLPSGTSILPIRASEARKPHSDEWFQIALKTKGSACCCLLLGNHVLDAVTFDESTSSVVLVASRDELQRSLGSVSLTVVDDVSGLPLIAVVQFRPETGETRNTTTDEKGSARVERLLKGDVSVRVSASMHAPITRKAVVRPGETVDLGVIRMVKTVEISGWVEPTAPSGPKFINSFQSDSMAAARQEEPSVFAYRIDAEQSYSSDPSATASADASGAFQISSLPPGEYLLSSVRNRPPSIKAVQEHKVLGWAYADVRFASASGVRVP